MQLHIQRERSDGVLDGIRQNEIIKCENKVGRTQGSGFGQNDRLCIFAFGKRRGNVVERFYSVETMINCTHVCFETAEPLEMDFIFSVCDVLHDTNTLKPTIKKNASKKVSKDKQHQL